jgi:hypothetical protein
MRGQRKEPKLRRVKAGSWLALLAATTLGGGADTLRAEVKARGLAEGAAYRLVVQSYDQVGSELPSRFARPVGSIQRTVTADELREGVQVDLLQLRAGADVPGPSTRPVVVAWIESAAEDLEFDGRSARPQPGNVYGVGRRSAKQDAVQIRLDRVAV